VHDTLVRLTRDADIDAWEGNPLADTVVPDRMRGN
jgi:hypothetical protein